MRTSNVKINEKHTRILGTQVRIKYSYLHCLIYNDNKPHPSWRPLHQLLTASDGEMHSRPPFLIPNFSPFCHLFREIDTNKLTKNCKLESEVSLKQKWLPPFFRLVQQLSLWYRNRSKKFQFMFRLHVCTISGAYIYTPIVRVIKSLHLHKQYFFFFLWHYIRVCISAYPERNNSHKMLIANRKISLYWKGNSNKGAYLLSIQHSVI